MPIIVSFWSVIEICRIYIGYAGNLRERVPQLAGFFFLTIFPQSVLISVMLIFPAMFGDNSIHNQWTIEKIFIIFQIIFLFFEIVFGFNATKNVIAAQTQRFKMRRAQRNQKEKKKSKHEIVSNENISSMKLRKRLVCFLFFFHYCVFNGYL